MSAALLVLLAVQAPPPATAASGITPAGMRRHIEIVAHDSMEGRAAPSRGLERATAYVASEFARIGLLPAGDSGGYEQRWAVSRWVPDTAESFVELTVAGRRIVARIGSDVRYVAGAADGGPLEAPTMLIEGPVGAAEASDPAVRGRIVLLPMDYTRPLPGALQERVEALARHAAAVLILSNRDSATFAERLRTASLPRLTPDFRLRDGAPVLEVRLRERDARAARTATRASVRLLPRRLSRDSVANLVGIVEGSDPRVRGEYVAITAHVDGVGLRPGEADSINNGADDNASGLAALLLMAEAFSDPAARPGRSLLFLVPSGEERGLWGSEYFVRNPTVPLERIVAALNMDLIGRNWTDSVIVVGPEFTTLGETLRRVHQARPELRMAPIADRWPEERIFYRSDHYHFARRGVPILFFTSGTHPDYHQPTDTADRLDVEKASRVARLVYHVAAAAADAPERPRWSPEHYRRIVEEK